MPGTWSKTKLLNHAERNGYGQRNRLRRYGKVTVAGGHVQELPPTSPKNRRRTLDGDCTERYRGSLSLMNTTRMDMAFTQKEIRPSGLTYWRLPPT